METNFDLNKCPNCGGNIEPIDKDTAAGRDIQLYWCFQCNWHDYVDMGIALWKAYDLAAQEEQATLTGNDST